SLYVIWDWADYWKIQQNESLKKVRNRYLGTFNHSITGFSEIRKPNNTPAHISIFKQNIDQYTQTSLPINWDPETDQSHVGWYIDLNPGSGERIIAPLTYLNDNVLIFITFTPTDSPCKAGGISHLYAVNIANTLNYKEIFQSMSENISLFLQPIDGMLHPPLISYQGSDQMILTFSSSAMPSISKIVLKENKHFKMRGIFDRRLFYWKAY
ncbi:Pyrrolo-quinoline quinone, partial [Candidatus Magnetomorum sp. HK-1]